MPLREWPQPDTPCMRVFVRRDLLSSVTGHERETLSPALSLSCVLLEDVSRVFRPPKLLPLPQRPINSELSGPGAPIPASKELNFPPKLVLSSWAKLFTGR